MSAPRKSDSASAAKTSPALNANGEEFKKEIETLLTIAPELESSNVTIKSYLEKNEIGRACYYVGKAFSDTNQEKAIEWYIKGKLLNDKYATWFLQEEYRKEGQHQNIEEAIKITAEAWNVWTADEGGRTKQGHQEDIIKALTQDIGTHPSARLALVNIHFSEYEEKENLAGENAPLKIVQHLIILQKMRPTLTGPQKLQLEKAFGKLRGAFGYSRVFDLVSFQDAQELFESLAKAGEKERRFAQWILYSKIYKPGASASSNPALAVQALDSLWDDFQEQDYKASRDKNRQDVIDALIDLSRHTPEARFKLIEIYFKRNDKDTLKLIADELVILSQDKALQERTLPLLAKLTDTFKSEMSGAILRHSIDDVSGLFSRIDKIHNHIASETAKAAWSAYFITRQDNISKPYLATCIKQLQRIAQQKDDKPAQAFASDALKSLGTPRQIGEIFDAANDDKEACAAFQKSVAEDKDAVSARRLGDFMLAGRFTNASASVTEATKFYMQSWALATGLEDKIALIARLKEIVNTTKTPAEMNPIHFALINIFLEKFKNDKTKDFDNVHKAAMQLKAAKVILNPSYQAEFDRAHDLVLAAFLAAITPEFSVKTINNKKLQAEILEIMQIFKDGTKANTNKILDLYETLFKMKLTDTKLIPQLIAITKEIEPSAPKESGAPEAKRDKTATTAKRADTLLRTYFSFMDIYEAVKDTNPVDAGRWLEEGANKGDIQCMLQRAQDLHKEGKTIDALALYEKVWQTSPNHREAVENALPGMTSRLVGGNESISSLEVRFTLVKMLASNPSKVNFDKILAQLENLLPDRSYISPAHQIDLKAIIEKLLPALKDLYFRYIHPQGAKDATPVRMQLLSLYRYLDNTKGAAVFCYESALTTTSKPYTAEYDELKSIAQNGSIPKGSFVQFVILDEKVKTARGIAALLTTEYECRQDEKASQSVQLFSHLKNAVLDGPFERCEGFDPVTSAYVIRQTLAQKIGVDYGQFQDAIQLCFKNTATDETTAKGIAILRAQIEYAKKLSSSIATNWVVRCYEHIATAYTNQSNLVALAKTHLELLNFSTNTKFKLSLENAFSKFKTILERREYNEKDLPEFSELLLKMLNFDRSITESLTLCDTLPIIARTTHLSKDRDWLKNTIKQLERIKIGKPAELQNRIKEISHDLAFQALQIYELESRTQTLHSNEIADCFDLIKHVSNITSKLFFIQRVLFHISARSDVDHHLETALELASTTLASHSYPDFSLSTTLAELYKYKPKKTPAKEEKDSKESKSPAPTAREVTLTKFVRIWINIKNCFRSDELSAILSAFVAWPYERSKADFDLLETISQYAADSQNKALLDQCYAILCAEPSIVTNADKVKALLQRADGASVQLAADISIRLRSHEIILKNQNDINGLGTLLIQAGRCKDDKLMQSFFEKSVTAWVKKFGYPEPKLIEPILMPGETKKEALKRIKRGLKKEDRRKIVQFSTMSRADRHQLFAVIAEEAIGNRNPAALFAVKSLLGKWNGEFNLVTDILTHELNSALNIQTPAAQRTYSIATNVGKILYKLGETARYQREAEMYEGYSMPTTYKGMAGVVDKALSEKIRKQSQEDEKESGVNLLTLEEGEKAKRIVMANDLRNQDIEQLLLVKKMFDGLSVYHIQDEVLMNGELAHIGEAEFKELNALKRGHSETILKLPESVSAQHKQEMKTSFENMESKEQARLFPEKLKAELAAIKTITWNKNLIEHAGDPIKDKESRKDLVPHMMRDNLFVYSYYLNTYASSGSLPRICSLVLHLKIAIIALNPNAHEKFVMPQDRLNELIGNAQTELRFWAEKKDLRTQEDRDLQEFAIQARKLFHVNISDEALKTYIHTDKIIEAAFIYSVNLRKPKLYKQFVTAMVLMELEIKEDQEKCERIANVIDTNWKSDKEILIFRQTAGPDRKKQDAASAAGVSESSPTATASFGSPLAALASVGAANGGMFAAPAAPQSQSAAAPAQSAVEPTLRRGPSLTSRSEGASS